jgi:dihydroxyacid dehydratase/phosphogluconate dehydratase
VREGDWIEIVIDRTALDGRLQCAGTPDRRLDPEAAAALLASRPAHPGLAPDSALPDDTRLWAALQETSGGTWGGAVFDVAAILRVLEAGRRVPGDGH